MNTLVQQAKEAKPKKGRMMQGPDFYRCCNTGFAPTIYRATRKLGGKYEYLVGPEIMLQDAVNAINAGIVSGYSYLAKGEAENRRVYCFKSLNFAREKFAAMVANAIEVNEQERAKHQAAIKAAKATGDLGALLMLADY